MLTGSFGWTWPDTLTSVETLEGNILIPTAVFVFFSVLPSNSPTPNGYPTIQLNSDTTYLEICQIPKLRTQSHKAVPILHSDTSCHRCSDRRSEVPITPSSSFINLLKWLSQKNTELRETFYLLDYQLIIKGHNSRRARWKRCTGQGHKIHMPSLGTPFSSPPRVHQSRNSPNAIFWGFMEASLHRHY